MAAGRVQPNNGASQDSFQRQILRQRAEHRARRSPAARAAHPDWPILGFAVGAFRFGLPLSDLSELFPHAPLTPVPGAPPALAGVFVLGGEFACAFHLPLLLGLASPPDPPQYHYTLVLRARQRRVGLPITGLDGLVSVARAAVRPAAEAGLSDPDACLLGIAGDRVLLHWPGLCRLPLLATL
jgi:purine-binding chemotaxis protein CheW